MFETEAMVRTVVEAFVRFSTRLSMVSRFAFASPIKALAVSTAVFWTCLLFGAIFASISRMAEAFTVQALSMTFAKNIAINFSRANHTVITAGSHEARVAVAHASPTKTPGLAAAIVWATLKRLKFAARVTSPTQFTKTFPSIADAVGIAIIFALRNPRAVIPFMTRVAETFPILADTISSAIIWALHLFGAVVPFPPRRAKTFCVLANSITVTLVQTVTRVDAARFSGIPRRAHTTSVHANAIVIAAIRARGCLKRI